MVKKNTQFNIAVILIIGFALIYISVVEVNNKGISGKTIRQFTFIEDPSIETSDVVVEEEITPTRITEEIIEPSFNNIYFLHHPPGKKDEAINLAKQYGFGYDSIPINTLLTVDDVIDLEDYGYAEIYYRGASEEFQYNIKALYNAMKELERWENEFNQVFDGEPKQEELAEYLAYPGNIIEPDEVVIPQLADSMPLMNVDDVHNMGNEGVGATICIIDTKINEGSLLAKNISDNLVTYLDKKGKKRYAVYDTTKNKQGKIKYILSNKTIESNLHGQVMVETVINIAPGAKILYVAIPSNNPSKSNIAKAYKWCLRTNAAKIVPNVVVIGVATFSKTKNGMVDYTLVTSHDDALKVGTKKQKKTIKAVWKAIQKSLQKKGQYAQNQKTLIVVPIGNAMGIADPTRDGVNRLAALNPIFGVGAAYDNTFPSKLWTFPPSPECTDGYSTDLFPHGPIIMPKEIACLNACSHTPVKNEMTDILAPGYEVVSSLGMDSSVASGTSVAAAHLAGVAALMYSKNPNLSVSEMHSAFAISAVPAGKGNYHSTVGVPDGCMGYGFTDAFGAVNAS